MLYDIYFIFIFTKGSIKIREFTHNLLAMRVEYLYRVCLLCCSTFLYTYKQGWILSDQKQLSQK